MSKPFFNSLSLLAALCLAAGSARAADSGALELPSDTTVTSQPPAPLLKGGVEHFEKMEPVPSYLKGGAKFDARELRKLTPNNYWFKIPSWLAGEWKEGEFHITTRANLKTGSLSPPFTTHSAEIVHRWGVQVDRSGQIWDCRQCPFNQKVVNSDGKLQGYALTTTYSASIEPDNPFRIHRVFTLTNIDQAGDRVSSSWQHDQIQTYSPQDRDTIRFESSTKVFDENGIAISQQDYWQSHRQVASFKDVNFRDGQNLRDLFKEYLSSHGMADLLPEN